LTNSEPIWIDVLVLCKRRGKSEALGRRPSGGQKWGASGLPWMASKQETSKFSLSRTDYGVPTLPVDRCKNLPSNDLRGATRIKVLRRFSSESGHKTLIAYAAGSIREKALPVEKRLNIERRT
jgi:hypothetical protein